jgi:hypothetical protein
MSSKYERPKNIFGHNSETLRSLLRQIDMYTLSTTNPSFNVDESFLGVSMQLLFLKIHGRFPFLARLCTGIAENLVSSEICGGWLAQIGTNFRVITPH